jgi:hypothetical protein
MRAYVCVCVVDTKNKKAKNVGHYKRDRERRPFKKLRAMMADKKCFSAEVFGADMARALDAFAALEVCISKDTLRGGAVAEESVPFDIKPTLLYNMFYSMTQSSRCSGLPLASGNLAP